MKLEEYTNHQLLKDFRDAVCDRNYNPNPEPYNTSGFTEDELEEEILKRMRWESYEPES